jgi:23S rRNA (cytosine1962-C5)-methyltransferase
MLSGHPWIFSGAIQQIDAAVDGDLVLICSSKGAVLGCGYVNSKCSLALRVLSLGKEDPRTTLQRNITRAVEVRTDLVSADTNAYRLINAEGDGVPGLVVDRYHDVLVIQVGTLGIDRQKDWILDLLEGLLRPRGIYERSSSGSRAIEGLAPAEGLLRGEVPPVITVQESGLSFRVDVQRGQKTGFFLDQREMRKLVRTISNGKSVLNCFCYSGGFSVYAAAGGARQVESVDVSAPAVRLAEENLRLNGFDVSAHRFVVADVFDILRQEQHTQYELVILDPPAFAKKSNQVAQARRGYVEINRQGMKRVAPGGVLLTCSCSHFIAPDMFRELVAQAAAEAGREAAILSEHLLAVDHPVALCHPEGAYLKSLTLRVY